MKIHSISILLLISFQIWNADGRKFRLKRYASSRGVDIPLDPTSLVTCLIPGLNELFCAGKRITIFEQRPQSSTSNGGIGFGYNDGVDLRFLRGHNIPFIGDQTNIGAHHGATFGDDWRNIQFGRDRGLFDVFRNAHGGNVNVGDRAVRVGFGERTTFLNDFLRFGRGGGLHVGANGGFGFPPTTQPPPFHWWPLGPPTPSPFGDDLPAWTGTQWAAPHSG